MKPANPAEWLVWQALVLTWPFDAIGALYVVGPVLAWILGWVAALSLYLGPAIRRDLAATGPVPAVVWAWFLGMAVMLIALWVGHATQGLGLAKTIKSSIGWAKGWALLALFVLAGAVLPIRREILIRGQCVVGLGTLILAPILPAAPYAGLPEKIFTSPLRAVVGPGPEYFSVYFFTCDPASWRPRWQFHAPWSPFAALLGVVMVLFAPEEKDRRWRAAGIAAGVLTASLAVVGTALGRAVEDAVRTFKGARADSTPVRETLQRIAAERWREDAPWFGHGTVHPGPHLVEFMPIGSHHTWWGLLLVKGLVGFFALVVPLAWQVALALWDAARGPRGRLPLGICMTIALLSFGENVEIRAYMLWPGLVVLGLHARELSDERAGRAAPPARALPA